MRATVSCARCRIESEKPAACKPYRACGRSAQSCSSCITLVKSRTEFPVRTPITSRTSSDNTCREDDAIKERQYDTKNINSVAREKANMKAAIIEAPPQ